MSRARLAIGALLVVAVAVVAAVGVAVWRDGYTRVEESVDAPRSGEAASNPLYVLKLALQRDRVQVQARQRLALGLHPLKPRDTVLIFRDPRTLSADDAKALLAWAERGGHLIVRTPPLHEQLGESPVPVLTELGVTLLDRSDVADEEELRSGCVGVYERGLEAQGQFCGGRRFYFYNSDSAPERAWGDEDSAYVYARFAHGQGHVDVVSDLDFLSNDTGSGNPLLRGLRFSDDKIAQPANAALARQLLAPNYRAGTVHLIYAAEVPSLWKTLIERSWMAWLPLLLWLLGWLWLRMQRFGPLRPAPALERRSLLEHIVASGEHVYRYGYGPRLYEAARRAFLARLRRRDPYAAGLDGEPRVALLAERFKSAPALSADEIRDALTPPLAREHTAFRTRIATLIRMRNRL
ncbi:DUF4350 domain-containing protein [Lysobacter antibioticus]|uniref:DUF4350 domain-containing protein n=1 Tax=Lysobacter antibioticus TaxID=84531 RepID=UPI00034B811F|nr:DUF4350 domain-containing protein [Lysobacter antibioticus]